MINFKIVVSNDLPLPCLGKYLSIGMDLQNNRILMYEECFGFHQTANASRVDNVRDRKHLKDHMFTTTEFSQ